MLLQQVIKKGDCSPIMKSIRTIDTALVPQIKKRIEKTLGAYVLEIDRLYGLSSFSPVLCNSIRDFVLRDGKRIRPILFIIGYSGFAKKAVPGLFTCALSFELLHDFTLIHDDIIDKADMRRGKPSVHTILNTYLHPYKKIKFNGQDLALVIGDILYAIAIQAFLAIRENTRRKEQALKKFIETAIYTGAGEFGELLYGIEDIEKITKQGIYRIYDFKTAYYSFAAPLITGATLAGARIEEVNRLSQYGVYLGRAFQIKDDIAGMFGDEAAIGKSILTDLQEGKKTILVWYAYRHATERDRRIIKRILARQRIRTADLLTMRRIVTASRALAFAEKEISSLLHNARRITEELSMKHNFKTALNTYSSLLLQG